MRMKDKTIEKSTVGQSKINFCKEVRRVDVCPGRRKHAIGILTPSAIGNHRNTRVVLAGKSHTDHFAPLPQ